VLGDAVDDDTIPRSCQFSPEHTAEPEQEAADGGNNQGRLPSQNERTPFTDAFPTTQFQPGRNAASGGGGGERIPQKLKSYWEAKVPEELKQIMVSTDDVFKPLCMTPSPELLKTMCAKSKCMELLRPTDEGLMYLPTYGSTMCFVAMGGSGELPEPIQEVLYFFGQVANSIGNYNPYVVPTEAVDVVVSVQ
jgi:hypothetical protein